MNKKITTYLHNHQIIGLPTESVWGLSCDPDSEIAVKSLLKIKKRSWKKGFILLAANYKQLKNYVDDSLLNKERLEYILNTWPGNISWLFPANYKVSYLLKGIFSSIAIRITESEPIRSICLSFGKPIVSTSANISGYKPVQTGEEIKKISNKIPFIINESIKNNSGSSKICDALTRKWIRI